MKKTVLRFVFVGLAGLLAPVSAQDKPVVAMIGTGTLAGTFGPAIGRAGYRVVYGSRAASVQGVDIGLYVTTSPSLGMPIRLSRGSAGANGIVAVSDPTPEVEAGSPRTAPTTTQSRAFRSSPAGSMKSRTIKGLRQKASRYWRDFALHRWTFWRKPRRGPFLLCCSPN